jgi:hypothetical protein
MMACLLAGSSAVIDISISSRLLGDGRLSDRKYVKAIWQRKRKRPDRPSFRRLGRGSTK